MLRVTESSMRHCDKCQLIIYHAYNQTATFSTAKHCSTAHRPHSQLSGGAGYVVRDALERPARAVDRGAETDAPVRTLDRLQQTLVVRRALVLGTWRKRGRSAFPLPAPCTVTCVAASHRAARGRQSYSPGNQRFTAAGRND